MTLSTNGGAAQPRTERLPCPAPEAVWRLRFLTLYKRVVRVAYGQYVAFSYTLKILVAPMEQYGILRLKISDGA